MGMPGLQLCEYSCRGLYIKRQRHHHPENALLLLPNYDLRARFVERSL